MKSKYIKLSLVPLWSGDPLKNSVKVEQKVKLASQGRLQLLSGVKPAFEVHATKFSLHSIGPRNVQVASLRALEEIFQAQN